VELLIAGTAHGDWESYEVDSDLLIPADAWQVTLGMNSGGKMPPAVVAGAPVEVRVGGATVMVGRVDGIDHQVDKSSHSLRLSGRDGAAALVDCSAPIFDKQQASLDDIVAAIVRDFHITRHVIDADATRPRKKINVTPGAGAWDMLADIAEANGLWPWFTPDGTLVIGGPDHSTPEVATLIMRKSGKDNNLLSLAKRECINERYSHFTVLGQTPGTDTETGKPDLRHTETDTGVSWHRPKIVMDYEADSTAACRDRARKLLADSRLAGFTLTASVKGHRIAATGQLWEPGQRVHVISEPHDIDATFFLMARKFTGGRNESSRTELTLKEDGVWTLDAHPPKRKHRRGKNVLPGRIETPGGAK
jgi:prophage tail gpP-like protein